MTLSRSDFSALLAPASERDDKYSRGCVGFVTGSERYPGAALLGIRTALNLGVGMVRYLGPKSVCQLVLMDRPEVVIGMDRAQCWVVGSGIADDDLSQAENLALAVKASLPMVIDAGALQQIDLQDVTNPELCLLTPHHREAARLLTKLGHSATQRDIDANPEEFAIELHRLSGIPVLLKSARSVLVTRDGIGQPDLHRLPVGNPNLAAAGSGDVLAAIIGALIARAETQSVTDSPQQERPVNSLGSSHLDAVVTLAAQIHSLAATLMAASGELGSSRLAEFVGKAAIQLRG